MCLIVSTWIPLISSPWWYIRIFDFPQLQLAGLLLVAIIATLLVFRRSVVVDYLLLCALVLSFGYTFYLIFPYTPLAEPRSLTTTQTTPGAVSILTANVYMENEEVGALKRMIDEINPDILLLLETNQRWIDQLDEIRQAYQYQVEVPKQNTYGMALYSKLPFPIKKSSI